MQNRVSILQIFGGVCLLVSIPQIMWTLIHTYILSYPDSKFGASGGVVFAVFFFGLAGLLAAFCSAITFLLVNKFRYGKTNYPIVAVLIVGGLLSILSKMIPYLPVLPWVDEAFGLILSWIVISFGVALTTFLIFMREKAIE